MQYLVQCVSGLQDVAARQLECESLQGVRLLLREEGLLVFETGTAPRAIQALPYLNNVFLVLGETTAGIDEALARWCRDERWQAAAARATTPKERTFRPVLSDAGQLVAGSPRLMKQAMETVSRVTRLRHSPRHADAEFWFLRRQSGLLFFCKRISRRSRTEKDLAKGELRPELAHLLVALSEPARTDIVLDPFVGSGALPLVRALKPYQMILGFDSDPHKVAALKAKVKADKSLHRRPIIIHSGDARRLDRIEDGFIDKIITDPPWGYYDTGLGDVGVFYREVLNELCRVLKPGGLLVLLIGRRELAGELFEDFADRLDLLERYELLVSGKKAAVLKARWRCRH